MFRFKRWVVASAIGISSLLGYHAVTPPVMEQKPITVVLPEPSPAEITPEIIEGQKPTIRPGVILGAVGNEKAIFLDGITNANKVLQSDCFEKAVLEAHFTEANGLTNEQIYILLASKLKTIGVKIFTGTFTQNYIYKTMGLEGTGDGVIGINRHFVDTAYEIGSVVLHEFAHNFGFKHFGEKSTSIPYTFNDIYFSCAKEAGVTQ